MAGTPSMYASQAYDVAYLLDSAVKKVGGKIEDRDAFLGGDQGGQGFRSRCAVDRSSSTRNQFPIQDQYSRVVTKMADGKYTNKMVGKVLSNHTDAYGGECKMQ
jgi:branched-chain amino acid transport system substrate-binding protein